MSANPPGDPNFNPTPTPQFGPVPGAVSPELLSQASSAFNLGLGSIIVGFCCCGLAGLIMGIMAMNNAGGVLTLAAPGSEAYSKASTARILGIVGIVLSVIQMIGGAGIGVVQNMNR